MSAVQSFPLLNLPLLPLKEVISYMNLIDQVRFSMFSKKTNNLVKIKQTFELEIHRGHLGTMNKVVCKNQNDLTFLTVEIKRFYKNHKGKYDWTRIIGGHAVPMTFDNRTLRTFWKDKMEGLQRMASLLCKTFRIATLSIDFVEDTAERSFQVIEIFRKLEVESNIKISKISMAHMSRDEDCIRYLLNKCSDIPEVTVWNTTNVRGFPDEQKMASSGTESYCEMENASWMTFNDLNLLTKCKKIKLWKLKLTNQELNLFLKKWMESSTMENVELTVENVVFQTALEGLSVTAQTKYLQFHYMHVGPKICFESQRKDGTKANFWNYGYFVMKTYK